MKTGFIGLGTMGLPMANCLARQGRQVIGWDTNGQARQAFNGSTESIETIASHCDVFITMLPEAAQVTSVIDSLLECNLPPGCLFIDCSTIDVESTRGLAAKLGSRGHGYVDGLVGPDLLRNIKQDPISQVNCVIQPHDGTAQPACAGEIFKHALSTQT